MVRPSQRHLADTFLWIGLLLLLFGIADLFPTSNNFTSSSPLAPAPPPSLPHLRSSSPSSHVNSPMDNSSTRASNRHLRAVPHHVLGLQSQSNHPVRADFLTTCQFTKSNPHLVADSRGFLCTSSMKESAGCCNPSDRNTKRYACQTCDTSRCCEAYEQCVSCCLSPKEISIRAAIEMHFVAKHYQIHSAFDTCSAACRSGSSSVVHENAYKHVRHHCFGLVPPAVDPALHRGVFDFATPVLNK